MDALAAWLAGRIPETEPACLVHNDFKLDNILVAGEGAGRAVAVLDWDMCTTGDPLMDLGYLLNVWTEAGDDPAWRVTSAMPTWRDGCLTRAEAVERYRRLTGFDVGDATWYHAFGAFKLAVVLQQIHIRWRRGQTDDSRFAGMSLDSRWKRLFVRNGSPSPANMRVGSSFSRLNANTPPVNGNEPGTFSSISHLSSSPWSSKRGSTTLRISVPDSDLLVSAVRISLSRIFTTYSSPE